MTLKALTPALTFYKPLTLRLLTTLTFVGVSQLISAMTYQLTQAYSLIFALLVMQQKTPLTLLLVLTLVLTVMFAVKMPL